MMLAWQHVSTSRSQSIYLFIPPPQTFSHIRSPVHLNDVKYAISTTWRELLHDPCPSPRAWPEVRFQGCRDAGLARVGGSPRAAVPAARRGAALHKSRSLQVWSLESEHRTVCCALGGRPPPVQPVEVGPQRPLQRRWRLSPLSGDL